MTYVGSTRMSMRSLTTTVITDTGYESNDTTHFFCGFPTETDYTFMQGNDFKLSNHV